MGHREHQVLRNRFGRQPVARTRTGDRDRLELFNRRRHFDCGCRKDTQKDDTATVPEQERSFLGLWRAGYGKAEIICAIEEAREIQRGREETAALPAPIFVKVGPRGRVWAPSERLLILGDKISRKCLKLSKAVLDEIKSTC